MAKKINRRKQITIAGHLCPNVEQWIDEKGLEQDEMNEGPQEARCIRKIVPANYVVINSETADEAESRIWDALETLLDDGEGLALATDASVRRLRAAIAKAEGR